MKQSFVFKNLVNRFRNTDFNLFLIGGAVRDLIFNQNTATDFDLITNAKAYADSILSSNDAMVFKGTIGTGGTVTQLPFVNYSAG